jgi:hypothetical protein
MVSSRIVEYIDTEAAKFPDKHITGDEDEGWEIISINISLVDPTPNMDTNNSNMYIERK